MLSWTEADYARGLPVYTAYLADQSVEALTRAYSEGMRDCFGFFARNACITQNALGAALLAKGITHIANLFGPIRVVTTWKPMRR